jgi:adenylate cyclase
MPRGPLGVDAAVDDRIVILDIDEKSLQEIGRWPWPRDVMAQIVGKLFDKYQIGIVGFDVVFAEADYSSGIRVLDDMSRKELRQVAGFQDLYQKLRPSLDNDGLFARAIAGKPVVLGYYLNSEKGAKRLASIPEPVLPKGAFGSRNVVMLTWEGYGGNIPELLKNAAGAGHFNPRVDDDGVIRRVPMLVQLDGAYYESLSLAMVRTLIALQDKDGRLPAVQPGFAPERFTNRNYSGLEWIKVGPVTIPVDDEVTALIPYRGGKGSFPYISLADVASDRVNPERLLGKVALVGTTAPGLLDLRATPVDSVYPGVEIHANLVAGMIDAAQGKSTLKQKPPFMLGAEVVLLAVGGVALAMMIPMLSALWATVAALAGLTLILLLNLGIWSGAGMVLPLAGSVLMTGMIYTMNMAYGYFVESRSKRQFTELFGQYVPPELVDEMARDPQKYTMEPKAADLTILFSDVRGFTSISEQLSPEDLKEYINAYLTDMSAIIRHHRGTLDKYIGDAIMAFWGAPVADADHARQGVITALEMQRECVKLREKFRARGWPEFNIGVGLNSGHVRVGDMGSQVRKAYTAMGDAVNLASRLEGRTKTYGVGILVGEATREIVKDVVYKELDLIKVKGKDTAVRVFEPIGLESEVDRKTQDELKLWHQTLRAYRQQQWDQVEVNLINLQRMNPGSELYQLYAERVSGFRRKPPPAGWAGEWVFEDK